MPQMVDFALQLAGRGWRIFPCHGMVKKAGQLVCSCGKDDCSAPGKRPHIKAWQKQATSNRERIEAWWGKWPQANIGLATGRQDDGTGLLVADIDDQEGRAELDALGTLEATLIAQTGQGAHVYWQGELGGTRRTENLLFRGEGGYVIAPPSLHASGVNYKWLDEQAKIAQAPGWLLQYIHAESQAVGKSEFLGEKPKWLVGQQTTVKLLTESLIKVPYTLDEYEKIKFTLARIPANCPREPWLTIGMALHSLGWERPDGTDIGFELWNEWSAGPNGKEEKYSLHDVEERWQSFGKRSGRTIRSLYYIAEHGWKAKDRTTLPATVNGAPFQGQATAVVAQPIRFPDRDKRGNPRGTCVNARVAIRGLGIECRYDTFHEKFRIGGHAIEQWTGDITDNVIHMLRVIVVERFGFDPLTQHARDAAVQVALANKYDPIADYLADCQRRWDGRPRIGKWLAAYMQADDTDLNSEYGRLGLIAAVRRVRRPGAKFDQIIVLEGPEGRGKSEALRILAGDENFSDQSILGQNEQRQQEALQGIWLYEIGELVGLRRAEIEHVKSFASRTTDRARPAYGHFRLDRPRRTILWASTNESHYLRSMTGNRRFWGLRTNHIRLAELERDRDQLWGEAAHHESQGASIMLSPRLYEAAGISQEERRLIDPWENILRETFEVGSAIWIDKDQDHWKVATSDILRIALDVSPERQNDGIYKRLSDVMLKLGFGEPKPLRVHGKLCRGFTIKKA